MQAGVLESHKNTCHNLKRQSVGVTSTQEIKPDIPAAAPLRRPRSPDSDNDRLPPRKFGPPGIVSSPTPAAKSYNCRGDNARGYNRAQGDTDRGQSDRGQSDRGRMDRGQSDRDQSDRGQSGRGPSDKGQSDRGQSDRGQPDRSQSDNRGRLNRSADDGNRPNARPNDRNRDNNYSNRNNENRQERPRNQDGGNRRYGQASSSRPQEDEDWGPKPSEPKPAAPKPSPSAPTESPSPKAAPTASAASPARPLASVADLAPVPARTPAAVQSKPATQPRPALVPKNCVIDTLSLTDTFMLTVESAGESGSSFICVTLHEDHSDNYERLLDPLSQACESSKACKARPGDTFAYLDPADGGWYRARCLAPTRAALVDAARVATLAPSDKCRGLPRNFAVIPEFCCLLESDKVQLKDQVQCTLVSKSGSELTVSLTNLETGASLGTGTVRRWLPTVEWPEEPAAASSGSQPPKTEPATASGTMSAATASSAPPRVPRPSVTAGSAVLLVDAAEPARVFVRPAARAQRAEFDDLVCEVAMYGADEATPRLKELPTAGQTVVARFTDDIHYRALVQRVSSKHKRCLLEYIEYGNAAIVEDMETLCPCPPQFEPSARPTLTSAVSLHMKQKAFSPAAIAYLDKLKDDDEELTLTIPSGEKSGPSNTLVCLTIVKSGEEVNRTVDQLSTPEWQKLMERGADVLETESVFFQQITYVDPPAAGGDMEILDCSLLSHGMLSGHARNADHAKRALALATQLDEYCNSALAKDPYTPKVEEQCIAMCPTRKQWLRAFVIQQLGGPGGADVNLLFYDYGNMEDVPVTSLRKMMPEFALGIPAAACSLVIKDFPSKPTEEQLERARRHLKFNDKGVGSLRVTKVTKQDVGEYLVEAPDLIKAVA